MEIARHSEEPGAKLRVRFESLGMADETEPGFLEQLLSHLTATRQPSQKAKEPSIKGRMDRVECRRIPRSHAAHERQLGLPVHTAKTHQGEDRDMSRRDGSNVV